MNDETERSNDASALVLFSGGQDSTLCLAWALSHYQRVATLGFRYGQRHEVELSCRQTILRKLAQAFPSWRLKLEGDHLLELPELGRISDTSLTRERAIELGDKGLPNTFVPGRNLLFFTYGAALGFRLGIHDLIGGMCQTDYSGYPDCRDDTLQSLAQSLSLGMDATFKIVTPLMTLSKAATWQMTQELGDGAQAGGGALLIDIVTEDSHSCYLGERGKRHKWGYGCGDCPACRLRATGWEEWQKSSNS